MSNETTMGTRRQGALAALVIAVAAVLALALAACQPNTLESYASSNQDKWNEEVVKPMDDAVDSSGGVFTDASVDVKGNDLTMTFVLSDDYASYVSDDMWDEMYDSMEDSMEGAIDDFEDDGIDDATITVNIDAEDGSNISTHTYK